MLLNVLPSLLQGTLVTLQVFFATLILSLPLACLLQALQQFGGKPVRRLFQLYVTLMRGTPLSGSDAEPGKFDSDRVCAELYCLFS